MRAAEFFVVATFVAEVVMIAVAIALAVYVRRITRQQHEDHTALLTFMEVQIRKTRHAVKNLAAALNMQAAVAELEAAGDNADEEVASR